MGLPKGRTKLIAEGCSLPSVGQAPRNEGVLLLVCRVTLGLLTLHAGANTPDAAKVNLGEPIKRWHALKLLSRICPV